MEANERCVRVCQRHFMAVDASVRGRCVRCSSVARRPAPRAWTRTRIGRELDGGGRQRAMRALCCSIERSILHFMAVDASVRRARHESETEMAASSYEAVDASERRARHESDAVT